jgi:hypothetical protein
MVKVLMTVIRVVVTWVSQGCARKETTYHRIKKRETRQVSRTVKKNEIDGSIGH